MVDESHRLVLEYTQDSKADAEATRAFARHEADESMATINRYLSEIARIFKEHDGTFDKYIGDCVMAFGALIPCRSHALSCVLASIAAQRRVRELNEERLRENRRREAENGRRAAAGQPLQRILPCSPSAWAFTLARSRWARLGADGSSRTTRSSDATPTSRAGWRPSPDEGRS